MRDWEKGSRNLARVCCVVRAPNHVKSDYALIRGGGEGGGCQCHVSCVSLARPGQPV